MGPEHVKLGAVARISQTRGRERERARYLFSGPDMGETTFLPHPSKHVNEHLCLTPGETIYYG